MQRVTTVICFLFLLCGNFPFPVHVSIEDALAAKTTDAKLLAILGTRCLRQDNELGAGYHPDRSNNRFESHSRCHANHFNAYLSNKTSPSPSPWAPPDMKPGVATNYVSDCGVFSVHNSGNSIQFDYGVIRALDGRE